jgi:glyoxylate reductase
MTAGKRDRRASASPRVFVAARFLDAVQVEFDEAFDTVLGPEAGNPLDALHEQSRAGVEFEGVLFSLGVKLDAAAISALPDSVRFLATYSVGTDHIDLEAARARGLAVFNTPGVLADSVAEDALLLTLGAARRATESIALIRGGQWAGWTPTQLVGVQLAGRTMGILGLGDIGRRLLRRAQALEMEVLYCNRRRLEDEANLGVAYRATPVELIRDCDVLVLLCPSTLETRGLVNRALLAEARPELIVVNVARGDVVEDDALIEALATGQIRAAGLDVFAGEPAFDRRYLDLPNVFMLPHIGSSTLEARLGMGRILISAVEAWRSGGPVANRVV